MIYCTALVCKVSAAETLVICGNFNSHAGKSYEGINGRCGCDLRSIDRERILGFAVTHDLVVGNPHFNKKDNTAQKMKFSTKDLVTFTEEILTGKLHFLCSVIIWLLTSRAIIVAIKVNFLFENQILSRSATKNLALVRKLWLNIGYLWLIWNGSILETNQENIHTKNCALGSWKIKLWEISSKICLQRIQMKNLLTISGCILKPTCEKLLNRFVAW